MNTKDKLKELKAARDYAWEVYVAAADYRMDDYEAYSAAYDAYNSALEAAED